MFNLITELSFDSDSGETSSFLNREAVIADSYDGRYKHISRYKYNETFSPKFTFLKKDFSDFSQQEVRQVLKWLTFTDTTAMLDVYYDHADDSDISWSAIGGWTEINTYKLGNNRIVGITATFEAITPYAMSKLYTQEITSFGNNKIEINIDTDDNKLVYPRITIKHNGTVVNVPDNKVYTTASPDMVPNTVYYNKAQDKHYWKSAGRTSGAEKPNYDWDTIVVNHELTSSDVLKANTIYSYANPSSNATTYYWIDPYFFHEQKENPKLTTTSIRFINKHTDLSGEVTTLTPTVIQNNSSSETIVLDGANKVISSSSVNRVFDSDFVNWNWLPLLDGKNEITIEGNCTVTFEWREVRKIGEY
jgi:hypothetical protein